MQNMKLCINGTWRDVEATDLDNALQKLGYADAVVATALNGQFVSVDARAHIQLADNDRVEIVAPMQGG